MKKIPKDFGSSAVAHTYNMIDDGVYREVHEEISQNANKEEFVIDEPVQIEEKTPASTVVEMTKAPEKEPVPEEKKEKPLPDFMKAE